MAKVIFLHLSDILFTGGVCLSACWDTTPPPEQTPPPPEQTPPGADPPRADPPGSRLQHTVNERPVRILLECILVITVDWSSTKYPHRAKCIENHLIIDLVLGNPLKEILKYPRCVTINRYAMLPHKAPNII